ncbi:basic secretory protein-like protein [Parabacteroides sp. AM08-6]|uniref:basic secretory protein-like protein n=1 Tax=Parabacteroides sp. AM08-6 TaxID=2292053 RepID=UPI000EFF4897|nr:basic secretory protein-like protein [Parabacteroides sp. AM08-6]RHJ82334.1 secretory protein [Parabacteroides sp. AM08-6]
MKKYLIFISSCLLFACQSQEKVSVNVPELTDGNPSTAWVGGPKVNKIIFDNQFNSPIQSYKVYSSGNTPEHDPVNWTLQGSYDGKSWVVVDERKDQSFCSRFQEKLCTIANPSNYKQYMLEAETANGDSLILGDVLFYEANLRAGWEDFKYPRVNFKVLDPEAKGSETYQTLVQNPDEYVQYHTQKVAEILFFSAKDTMNDVQEINYTLKEYDGVSAKSGNPPSIAIVYSTKHIQRSAEESLYKLDFETRGVLYHELVHAYQFEPKGIGSYSTNKEFWACIEGMADAVRAQAGLFDMSTRKPGGNWMDGYRTTGFFIQWLTTKDPDAIRKFHLTVRDLDVWSFDKAIKSMFGPESSIECIWNEYQEFLTKSTNK